MRRRRDSTANTIATRLGSQPLTRRAGWIAVVGFTSAWTSTSRQRLPSIAGTTQLPGTPGSRSAMNTPDGSATSSRPRAPMRNSPSSLVEP